MVAPIVARCLSQRILVIGTSILLFAGTFAILPHTRQEAPPLLGKIDYHAVLGDRLNSYDLPVLTPRLRELYKPIVVPIDAPGYSANGTFYSLDHVHWTRSLGKDLCIADIDTRGFAQPGQLLSEDFTWAATDTLSAGMMSHYLYASVHGYTYHFIRPESWPNNARIDVWTKIPTLRKLLDVCQIVLMIDGDVVIQHPALPFEWLLNRWNFTPQTSLALPLDTIQRIDDPVYNPHRLTLMNGGVVVAQSSARTKEMVDAWIECPDNEERFPGCQWFASAWPAEQGALNNYVQQTFKEPEDLKQIPCDEANGFPGQRHDDPDLICTGVFLRHFTSAKDLVKDNVEKILMEDLSHIFAKQLHLSTNGQQHG